APRWQIAGFLPAKPVTLQETTGRNMLGFKDGTANPSTQDAGLMHSLVWVQPGAKGEPAWTAGGSYQVIRLIRNLVERWDRTQLAGQEAIIGRHKLSGAPLGMQNENDTPDFTSPLMPPKAHIRLANPRTAATEQNRIFRRGYNYSLGLDRAGHMNMGLIFASYQASLDDGFRSVQQRLNGEPLEEYIKPFGGGYFFTFPGVSSDQDFLGSALL
ncbi:MAG: Dyp-type peroxidase, partial [Candidatus Saccharibacteria bacterium]|nr:Dyp-type peroxidase [Pseudorhodobacter sp.]